MLKPHWFFLPLMISSQGERFRSLLLKPLNSFFQHLTIRHKRGTAAPARRPGTGLLTPPLPLAVVGLLGGCFSYPRLMPQGPAEMVPFSQALLSRPPSLGVSGLRSFPHVQIPQRVLSSLSS